MFIVESIAKIRRLYYRERKGFKTIARELNVLKTTVKKIIREDQTSPSYLRRQAVYPALGALREVLISKLEADRKEPVPYRRTAKKLYKSFVRKGSQADIRRSMLRCGSGNKRSGSWEARRLSCRSTMS